MLKYAKEDLGVSENECKIQNVTTSPAMLATSMSSILLYNYLPTFTDSDSCESFKKGSENITIMQLPRNRA